MGRFLPGIVQPLSRKERRAALSRLKRDNAAFPRHLLQLRETAWPMNYRPPRLREVWRARDFLVQVFDEGLGITRLSVCRTSISTKEDRWVDGISWDELQRLKRECGRGHLDAAEAYPRDSDVVELANIRHLFVFAEPLPWLWRKE